VPIVEPEVLMDGAHTDRACEEVHRRPADRSFSALHGHRIHLEGMILKPNMGIAGKKFPQPSSPEQVAAATVRLPADARCRRPCRIASSPEGSRPRCHTAPVP